MIIKIISTLKIPQTTYTEASKNFELCFKRMIFNKIYIYFSDLMQYPIFPWILAEYKSNEEPDLTDPATFRDLTKPMGAQTDQRLVQFKKRFKDWDDPHGDTPPYHYGTHYSSAMIGEISVP